MKIFFVLVFCCMLGFTVLSAANENAFAQDNNRTSRAAQLEQSTDQSTGQNVLVKRFIAKDRETRVGKYVVTIVMVNDEILQSTARPISEFSKREINEIIDQPVAVDTRRKQGAFSNGGRDEAGFALELDDVDLLYEDSTSIIFKYTYSNGAEQIGHLNRLTGVMTFGPVVGGN